jgi:ribosomal protein L37AE/L43A
MQNEQPQQPVVQPVEAPKQARAKKPKCPICKKKALYRDMKTCNQCGKKLTNGKKYVNDSLLYAQFSNLI